MIYTEVVNYIENTMRFGCRPGLERTSRLLELLNNPHKQLKLVHVAGTNGKGSTTSMLVSMLKHSGYSVGMYISPHLYRNTERMTINGVEITEQDFTDYALRVIEKVNYMKNNNMEEPTQFEMLTAMAFLYFAEKQVDWAVIEVGLGGTYDATNVIDAKVAVITSISYDHMDILGNTIEEIAAEKAGIIKKDSIAVVYPQPYAGAMSVIEERCKQVNAKLIKVNESMAAAKCSDENGHIFDFSNNAFKLNEIKLPLIGDHQLKNAATAVSAVLELKDLGYDISEESIKSGLEAVVWPCRLSIVSRNPYILIDGAHNEEGVDSLKAALIKYFSKRKKIFVFGMLKDKSFSYAIEQLMPLADAVVATQPISPRALTAEEMAEQVKRFCHYVIAEEDIEAAVDKATELCDDDSMICVCGSLYLAGSAYEYITKSKNI